MAGKWNEHNVFESIRKRVHLAHKVDFMEDVNKWYVVWFGWAMSGFMKNHKTSDKILSVLRWITCEWWPIDKWIEEF